MGPSKHRSSVLDLEETVTEGWDNDNSELCQICHLQRREFRYRTRDEASVTQSFIWQKHYYSEEGIENASNINIIRGQSAPSLVFSKGAIQFFNWLLTIDQKNVSRLARSYQTHTHNIHFKVTELVRSFLRRNMFSSKIHCCYIIISMQLKKKIYPWWKWKRRVKILA